MVDLPIDKKKKIDGDLWNNFLHCYTARKTKMKFIGLMKKSMKF